MTLEERNNHALELRKQGYNCAQTVLMVFASDLGMDEATAAKLTSGLGGGVGACGEICGVPLAMAIAQSCICGGDPTKKEATYGAVKTLVKQFEEENGNVRCRDLKTPPMKKTCNEYILSGIKILYKALNHNE